MSSQEGIDARSFAPLLRGEEVLSSLGHFRYVRTRRWKHIDKIGIIKGGPFRCLFKVQIRGG